MRLFSQALSSLNMQSRFSALLWLEELHAQMELKEFSISGALLKKGAGSLRLDVPGLAEGRPHLSIGENMTVTNAPPPLTNTLLTPVFSRRQSATEETPEEWNADGIHKLCHRGAPNPSVSEIQV